MFVAKNFWSLSGSLFVTKNFWSQSDYLCNLSGGIWTIWVLHRIAQGLHCSFWALLSLLAAFHLVSVFVFRCNCCAWCLGLLESEVPFHPCSLAPPFSSTKEFLVGWGPLAGLPWIPPLHARALPGSTNFVGTNAQAHLLVMSLTKFLESKWLPL